jgi:MoaA/NifB/PqqE/SkfB family radical SAM enzyme
LTRNSKLTSGLARINKSIGSWAAATFAEPVTGALDQVEPTLAGWAYNHRSPEERVAVHVFLNGRFVYEAVADRHREDLSRAGYGDGCHGFDIPMFSVPGLARAGGVIEVRVQGSEHALSFQGLTQHAFAKQPSFGLIASDVVNNCNLRCPFCLVDYSRIKSTETMTEEVFLKMTDLAEMTRDGQFILSCLHEPTLHPQLARLVSILPKGQKQKFAFTTNLAKPLRDDMFEAWAGSGIDHINISLDTFDADLFAILRKFGRLKVFEENLNRLVRVFAQHPSPPRLRYITMAFKSNMREIPDLIRKTSETYHSSEHEIRFTINMQHIRDDFRKAEYLVKDDWDWLTENLAPLPHPYLISYPHPGHENPDVVFPSANYQIKTSGKEWYGGRVAMPMTIRIRVDGALLVVGHEDHWTVNIKDLDDPKEYLYDMLDSAWLPVPAETPRP